ncbi:DoxX family protein [Rhizobium leguminosarum]|uniref:DoxX family protein n=1 Tax=Rhizobium leguminosarum TaxID=384 RepID=UPI000556878E|nr:DoxX family protein [Rhizobium leguminosarum]ASS58053.1 DoxX family protein [Rhizobium leguminosarum bv. viciae]MBB4329981.1 putative oxidoreductase [Rhizobium leguminosarum]MBB4355376.1 putative oxidoreductase [Rhizobium leguminosarum]MBB4389985.1 putative oxidoreductase [Rhizobium leguminosarum]MBB4550484.1 putative oxidoreductase [Rhizobium leguminosarum]
MSLLYTLSRKSVSIVTRVLLGIETVAWHVAPPTMRIALALPFFRSGLTRWDGFLSLSPGTLFLFEEQFKLHIFGGEYALPVPDQLALMTAIAEIVLPALLLAGLGTRFAALGLLVMTGVIQLVFPDGWSNFHLYWAALAVGIVAIGPGVISLDHWIGRSVTRSDWRGVK